MVAIVNYCRRERYALGQLTLAEKRAARCAAGSHASCPVQVVEGDCEPRIAGRSYYWTTPSGKTEVRFPRAYRWPTRYWHSTLRVEVGVEWLARATGKGGAK